MKGVFEYWIMGTLTIVVLIMSFMIFSEPVNVVMNTFLALVVGNTNAVNIMNTVKASWNLWLPIMIIAIMFFIFLANFRKSPSQDNTYIGEV